MMTGEDKKLLRVLRGETCARPPIWLMRQAGRYLPEYKATRAQAGGFLDLCYNPDLATEVTLQPIRRFGFDAAILFADILLIPQALGMDLWFETGEGPRLTPITSVTELKPASDVHETLSPIYETVGRLSEELPKDVTLIGFAGAPWTVVTYMIAGRGSPDQAAAHKLMNEAPEAFDLIIDRVADATVEYLSRQIEAGAEVVKLFDSWASSLKGEAFDRASLKPCLKIVDALRARHPDVPVIGFPRGAKERSIDFAKATGVACIAIDQSEDPVWARDHLQPITAVQGNLDPGHMITGGDAMVRDAEMLIETLGNGPYVFNLGHGITPEADPANVEKLVRLVQG
jgi:uroporphyrinogen decarboxylase